jgi:hypothetical protein
MKIRSIKLLNQIARSNLADDRVATVIRHHASEADATEAFGLSFDTLCCRVPWRSRVRLNAMCRAANRASGKPKEQPAERVGSDDTLGQTGRRRDERDHESFGGTSARSVVRQAVAAGGSGDAPQRL